MEDTGTTAPDWEELRVRVYSLAAEFAAVTGTKANVLYLGWDEHLALARWASPATASFCNISGHTVFNGWRLIRVAEKNWLAVGRYEVRA